MASLRGSSWQARVKGPDKYHRYSFPTQAQAEEWERQARQCIREGKAVTPPNLSQSKRLRIADLCDMYGDAIWGENKVNKAKYDVIGALKYLKDCPADDLTSADMVRMVAAARAAGKRPSTINAYLSRVRTLLAYAKELGDISVTLTYPKVTIGDNARLRFLTESEERQLIELMDHWGLEGCARLTELLIDTGCRTGEIIPGAAKAAPIHWTEVSEGAGGTSPAIRDPKTGEYRQVVRIMRTKTAKPRTLPLTDRAAAALRWSKSQGHRRPFDGVSHDLYYRRLLEAAKHLGMDDVVPYTMRHTCASRLVQRGADLRRVQTWMGHARIEMTLRYAKLVPTDIFELGDML